MENIFIKDTDWKLEKLIENGGYNHKPQWKGTIDYNGVRYHYELKPARHRVDMTLATTDPRKYCNGISLYSDKDPFMGGDFVIVKTEVIGKEVEE